jgi:predicted alpha/beta hydrolase
MRKSFTIKLIAIQAIITPATAIFAHDGHNLSGSHWHASDVFGFVILAAAIGMAFWFGRGGK